MASRLLGIPGGAAGFKNVERFAGETFRQPALQRAATQPFVFERRKPLQILETANLTPRVPAQLCREVEPERTPGFRIEMPLDDLAHMGIEFGLRFLRFSETSRLPPCS